MIKVCLKYPFFNLSLTAKGVFIALLLILYNPQELQSQKPFKIVIDAGHGGKDLEDLIKAVLKKKI